MKGLIARFRQSGVLFLIGFILIIYIALGFLYLQQTAKQKELQEQVDKINVVLVKPLASDVKLREEYDQVNRAMTPLPVNDALKIIVDIASKSGIDIEPDKEKLVIPPATTNKEKIGNSSYGVLSFQNINVQGSHEAVMAFISDIDSGKTLANMKLKKLVLSKIEYQYEDEEGARRSEYHQIVSAVKEMIADNKLEEIPNPVDYAGRVATNIMGVVPGAEEEAVPEEEAEIEETVPVPKGFPDITTTASDRGYTGEGAPVDGYLLYNHDKIDPDDTTKFTTKSYITVATTKYFYTCESDGIIRQFDGADVTTATEYEDMELGWVETLAIIYVSIYTRLQGDKK